MPLIVEGSRNVAARGDIHVHQYYYPRSQRSTARALLAVAITLVATTSLFLLAVHTDPPDTTVECLAWLACSVSVIVLGLIACSDLTKTNHGFFENT
jgi:hypothetical protein